MKTTLDLFGKKEVDIDYFFSYQLSGYGHYEIIFTATYLNSTKDFKTTTTDMQFIDDVKDMIDDNCTSDEKQEFIAKKYLEFFESDERVLNWASDIDEEVDNI